ncbi:glycosyl hydrolase family 61-domain-containing protein [Peziza echinospora]|nr:glycosyl hydrolase family 61-domain-containing protein [Peziza echinospora]
MQLRLQSLTTPSSPRPPTLLSLLTLLLATLTQVRAHGHVNHTRINGQVYDGFNVDYPERPTIFRSITTDHPVRDLTSKDMACGVGGGEPAPLSAEVAPGDTISVDWGFWPGSHLGPVTAYLAKCPESCTDYVPEPEDKVWFKIAEKGKATNGTYYNIWASHHITNHNPFTIPLPRNLAAGNYILRHEIISLATAKTYPGIEVQPSCFQLTVGGAGRGVPRESDLVSFPGAYGPGSEGVTWNVWDASEQGIRSVYPVPGPGVAVLVDGE